MAQYGRITSLLCLGSAILLFAVNYNAKDLLPQVSRGGNFPEFTNEPVFLQLDTCSAFMGQCMCFHIITVLSGVYVRDP